MNHASDETVYAVSSDIRLVNLMPIAVFSEFNLTTSNGNSLESIDHPHVVSFMYKLLNSILGRMIHLLVPSAIVKKRSYNNQIEQLIFWH